MLGMVDYNVESVKFIGRRDMDMDTNIKTLFDESDENWNHDVHYDPVYGDYYKPYFNDAKELFKIWFLV